MKKLRKGDLVRIMVGKDKKKEGKILDLVSGQSVLVEGVNLKVKHVKPNPSKGVSGGIVKEEAPLDISNVRIVNPTTGNIDKVSIQIGEDGVRRRVFRSSGELVAD